MSTRRRRADNIAEFTAILDRFNAPDLSEGAEQRLIRRLQELSKHPWCYPEAALDRRYVDVLRQLRLPEVPQVGEVLLVGVQDDGTRSLMRLRSDARTKSSGQVLEQTKDAWDIRRRAAERATRYILNAQLQETPINIEPLFETMSLILSGNSYGLAFGISQASLLLECPVSSHIVALAAIDGDGNTEPVGKLPEKIREVLQNALNVHTFFVTPCQEEEARQALACYAPDNDTLEVVGVETVGKAIQHLWPDLDSEFERRLKDPDFVDELLDELYTKTLEGWGPFQVWHPVIRTLKYLLETNRVHGDGAVKARFALSIALRHAGKGDAQFRVRPSFDEITESETRADNHAAILRQYVQSCMDAGAPLPDDIQATLTRLRGDLQAQRGIYSDTLRTLGAHARVLTRDGQPAAAFDLLDMVLNGWWDYRRHHSDEASHPLCAMLHCVELMQDADARANVTQQMQRFEAWGVKDSYWLDFAHARVLLAFGEATSAARIFERLSNNDQAPTYMRYSSARWHWRCAPSTCETASAHLQTIRRRMQCLDNRASNEGDLRTFAYLSLLDYGLHVADDAAIEDARKGLARVPESQLFRRLSETTPPSYASDAQWLADAYAY